MTAHAPQITWERVDGHGADDYESDAGQAWTAKAAVDGQHAAHLNINARDDGSVRIRWIETAEAYQRRGIGRLLLGALQTEFPDMAWETGGFTDEGAALFSTYPVACVEGRDLYLDDDNLNDDEDDDVGR